MNLRGTDVGLQLAVFLLQGGILSAMLRRGLQRRYPVFAVYIGFQLGAGPLLFALHGFPATYFYAYYAALAGSFLLSFAVLRQLMREAFHADDETLNFGLALFRWCVLVLAFFIAIWVINSYTRVRGGGTMEAVLLTERALQLMQCGLAVLVLLCSQHLGISSRSMLVGIAVGFWLFALTRLLTMSGPVFTSHVARWIENGAYVLTCLTWLTYAWMQHPSPNVPGQPWQSAAESV